MARGTPASTQKIHVLTELYRQYKEGKLQPPDHGHDAAIMNHRDDGLAALLDELVDYVPLPIDNRLI